LTEDWETVGAQLLVQGLALAEHQPRYRYTRIPRSNWAQLCCVDGYRSLLTG
jgi:hypothetical protein